MPKRTSPALLDGHIHQYETPVWEPLLEIVGDDLSGWFMWMGETRLESGLHLHAYKHRDTRRYLHIAASGEAFRYVAPEGDLPNGRYVELSRADALLGAFHNWSEFGVGYPEFERNLDTLERAISAAREGHKVAFDPDALDRQRRFERAVAEARRGERRSDPGFGEVRGLDGDAFYGDMEDLDDVSAAA